MKGRRDCEIFRNDRVCAKPGVRAIGTIVVCQECSDRIDAIAAAAAQPTRATVDPDERAYQELRDLDPRRRVLRCQNPACGKLFHAGKRGTLAEVCPDCRPAWRNAKRRAAWKRARGGASHG